VTGREIAPPLEEREGERHDETWCHVRRGQLAVDAPRPGRRTRPEGDQQREGLPQLSALHPPAAEAARPAGVLRMSSPQGPGSVPDYTSWITMSAPEILRRAYYYTGDPVLAQDIARRRPSRSTRPGHMKKPGARSSASPVTSKRSSRTVSSTTSRSTPGPTVARSNSTLGGTTRRAPRPTRVSASLCSASRTTSRK